MGKIQYMKNSNKTEQRLLDQIPGKVQVIDDSSFIASMKLAQENLRRFQEKNTGREHRAYRLASRCVVI